MINQKCLHSSVNTVLPYENGVFCLSGSCTPSQDIGIKIFEFVAKISYFFGIQINAKVCAESYLFLRKLSRKKCEILRKFSFVLKKLFREIVVFFFTKFRIVFASCRKIDFSEKRLTLRKSLRFKKKKNLRSDKAIKCTVVNVKVIFSWRVTWNYAYSLFKFNFTEFNYPFKID